VDRVVAPAKLTTSLAMVGLRGDGYHLLDAEMVTISLADTLTITPEDSGFTMTASRASRAEGLIDPTHNLCLDALALVGRQAAIALEKVIPVGGGLGGGSADAAAVLRWAGCADLTLAAQLGSDVPFCVLGGRAAVSGVGEIVTPLHHEERSFCLIVPDCAVSTPAVYRAFDAVGKQDFGQAHRNDLYKAALTVSPALATVVAALRTRTGLTPSLAGSGSTLFSEGTSAQMALDQPLAVDGISLEVYDVVTVPPGWNGEEK